jgi:hypothetical protein
MPLLHNERTAFNKLLRKSDLQISSPEMFAQIFFQFRVGVIVCGRIGRHGHTLAWIDPILRDPEAVFTAQESQSTSLIRRCFRRSNYREAVFACQGICWIEKQGQISVHEVSCLDLRDSLISRDEMKIGGQKELNPNLLSHSLGFLPVFGSVKYAGCPMEATNAGPGSRHHL